MKLTLSHPLRQRVRNVAAGASLALMSVGMAFAQSDPGEEVFTEVTTRANTYIASGFTLLGVILAALIGMKVLKKVANRAT